MSRQQKQSPIATKGNWRGIGGWSGSGHDCCPCLTPIFSLRSKAMLGALPLDWERRTGAFRRSAIFVPRSAPRLTEAPSLLMFEDILASERGAPGPVRRFA